MSSEVIEQIKNIAAQTEHKINIMEVCGTHTQAIYRYGIKDILPANINLISGPGCPVCVTDIYDIDYLLAIAAIENVHICCYGDMLRVPGTNGSLYEISAKYGNVHIVTSGEEALAMAMKHSDKLFVFWAVGFETTTPMTAVVIKKAYALKITNFKVLCRHKTMPEVLSVILADNNKIDALLCPGHVAVITGVSVFNNLPMPAVISGFEEKEILSSILILLKMYCNKDSSLINNYTKFVRPEGNPRARKILDEVFEPCDALWRGIGKIKSSGLKIREIYSDFDADKYFGSFDFISRKEENCLCGEIIKGNCSPVACSYFGKACTPMKPIGPCMVSSEGACAAFYKYGRNFQNE